MENWKDIIGYEGLYQVSNLGRVKSLDRQITQLGYIRILKGKFLSPTISRGTGYFKVTLCRDGKQISHKIHRLLAAAFIPNIDNKPQVNHINGVKTDNRIENLEWCTSAENVGHSYKNGLQIKKLTEAQALEIFQSKGTQTEIGNSYGVSHSTVHNIKRGKQWAPRILPQKECRTNQ